MNMLVKKYKALINKIKYPAQDDQHK